MPARMPKQQPEVAFQPINIGQQALEAKDAGIADVVRLLQQPEDLARLPQLRAEYDQRHRSNKAQLSATVQSQVEAARYGLDLLDKSHRHIAKLRLCIDKIDQLCAECTSLVENHEKIRALSYAHRNVEKVLEELADIIDLPVRAAAVEEMLEDSSFMIHGSGLCRAFEGLTVLDGTANNVKEAWVRNVKKRQDIGELQQYLTKIGDTLTAFEHTLWGHVRNYAAVARNQPRLLVDCCRIIEIQEQMDAHYVTIKAKYMAPRHYKERAFMEMEGAVRQRFEPLLAACAAHGVPNQRVRFDQHGNRVAREQRDYLGALTDVVRIDPQGRQLPAATDAELAGIVLHEEGAFDEDMWVDSLIRGLAALEIELPEAYDFVAPCFPPHFGVFEAIFQMYHIQFAQAVDIIGQSAEQMSTKSQLKVMEWIGAYQNTLRGLGVEEELVRLPVAPLSDPEGEPGLRMLIQSYTARMESTVTSWYRNILEADMASVPKQMADGTLRTMGATDFFRILNEQVQILEDISRGEVLFEASKRSLKVMKDFTAAQSALLARGLSLEMMSALLNNNVDCYSQSLEFTEHVQELLEEAYKEQLEVEEVCRGFLELSKTISHCIVDMMFGDAGMLDQLKKLYVHQEWLSGTTTATIIATINDYFGDIGTFVDASFTKRIVEWALEDLARRYSSALFGSLPSISEQLLKRMAADERDLQAFFERFLRADKVSRLTSLLSDLKELASSNTIETMVLAYSNILEVNPAITPPMVEKLCSSRSDLTKAQVAEVIGQCKDVHQQHLKRATPAANAAPAPESRGWKFWGRTAAPPMSAAAAGPR